MRRPFGRHDPLPWLMAAWHGSRFYWPRQGHRKAHWPTPPPAARLGRVRLPPRGVAGAGAVVVLALFATAASWWLLALPPLAVSDDLSVTVLDRNGRLLRAYTTS